MIETWILCLFTMCAARHSCVYCFLVPEIILCVVLVEHSRRASFSICNLWLLSAVCWAHMHFVQIRSYRSHRLALLVRCLPPLLDLRHNLKGLTRVEAHSAPLLENVSAGWQWKQSATAGSDSVWGYRVSKAQKEETDKCLRAERSCNNLIKSWALRSQKSFDTYVAWQILETTVRAWLCRHYSSSYDVRGNNMWSVITIETAIATKSNTHIMAPIAIATIVSAERPVEAEVICRCYYFYTQYWKDIND